MVFLVLFALIWTFLLTGAALLAPPLADLLLRKRHVPWWYALPALLPTLPLLLLPLAFIDGVNWDAISSSVAMLSALHFVTAGLFLYLGITLAIVRGLRPGGPTERRLRTSVVAFGIMAVVGAIPVMLSVIDEGWAILTSWLPFGCLGGAVWILAVNRRGPHRLTTGKRWSAAFLLASFYQLALSAAHFAYILRHDEPAMMDVQLWMIVMLAVLGVGLPVGLRALSGPLPVAPLFACSISAMTLLVPPVEYFLWRPLPHSMELAQWVSLDGSTPRQPTSILRHLRCAEVFGVPRRCNYRRETHLGAAPSTRLDALNSFGEDPVLLIEDGRRTLPRHWAYLSNPVSLTIEHGVYVVGDRTAATKDALHETLVDIARTRHSLVVVRHPDLTVQDFVSICASFGNVCQLEAFQAP